MRYTSGCLGDSRQYSGGSTAAWNLCRDGRYRFECKRLERHEARVGATIHAAIEGASCSQPGAWGLLALDLNGIGGASGAGRMGGAATSRSDRRGRSITLTPSSILLWGLLLKHSSFPKKLFS